MMRNYWSTLLIMVLTFVGIFRMQSFLDDVWALNFLLFGVVLACIVLAGIAMEKSWVSAMRTIFFSVSIGTAALLFYNIDGAFFVFTAVLFINLVGLVSSILDAPDDFDFDSGELPELVHAHNLPSENMQQRVVLTSEPANLLKKVHKGPEKSSTKKKHVKKKIKKAVKKQLKKSKK